MVNNFHKQNFECRRMQMTLETFMKNESHFIRELQEHPEVNCVEINGEMSPSIANLVDVLRDTNVKIINIANNTMNGENLIFLALSLKYSKFISLSLCCCGIQSMEAKFLAAALNGSRLSQISMPDNKIGDEGIFFLANGLINTEVKYLNLNENGITFYGMTYLARILEVSSLNCIDLNKNRIKDLGLQFLAGYLKNSNITKLNLDHSAISDVGLICLADNLKESCVTSLSFRWTEITDDGIDYMVRLLDDTQITDVEFGVTLTDDNTRAALAHAISRNCTNASKINSMFEKLIVQNTKTLDLEFIIPDTNDFDVTEYLRFIKQISDNKNVRGHIFNMLRENNCYHYPHIIKKINEFIAAMPSRFSTFIANNFHVIKGLLGNYDYVNFVKQLENLNLHGAIQHLLSHRTLYFVDEDEEILHPYIYKMLHKYNMPLYGSQLKYAEKNKIISFFEAHQEIDGAKEIVDFLG